MLQPVVAGYSSVRFNFGLAQPLVEGYSTSRLSYALAQPLEEGYSVSRLSFMVCQALFSVLPELPMSTDAFPGFGNSLSDHTKPMALDPFNSPLPGLSYGIHKKPMFKTNVKESAAMNEVRTSLSPYPRWTFDFTYEFLEDSSGAQSSLKTIMGFFLARQGMFDTFLVKDPDDYIALNSQCGGLPGVNNADGTITEFPFCRTMGAFNEKVGQVDMANTIAVTQDTVETYTVPGTGGLHTYTVLFPPPDFIADMGVTKAGVPLTYTAVAPVDHNHYNVDPLTGIYTFFAAGGDPATDVKITYARAIASGAYTIRQPNMLVFGSAPPAGIVRATFQFFFACRFLEDTQDYDKFYDKLWSLQKCSFVSVIQ
jgi:hypothetical protein